ncbi:protein LAZ1 [Tanacetum coccineum]
MTQFPITLALDTNLSHPYNLAAAKQNTFNALQDQDDVFTVNEKGETSRTDEVNTELDNKKPTNVDSDSEIEEVYTEYDAIKVTKKGASTQEKPMERRTLWADLDMHKYVVRGFPWVLMGDFNVALNIEDSYSGSSMMNSAMCGFKDCVKKIEVIDINSYGLHFTWNQKPKGSNRMLKKLDRIMGNLDFVDNFPGAYALFQPYRISDHSPTVLKMPSMLVTQKMKNLKKPLRKLLHDQGNLHELVNRLRVKLDVVQKAIDADPSNSLLRDDEAAYIQAFNEAKIDKEHFLCQKEKIEWLDVFVSDYESFLGTNMVCEDLDTTGLFGKRVSDNSNANMIRHVTNKEIKRAMFDIEDVKSLGPDGYKSDFFKKGWDVVRNDVCRAVCDFFDNGKLLKEINHTFLALIPNVPTPLRVTDFWPISCCNVLYKCISKILTNRIIEGIKELVSENQSAFVPGRRISDNILLTQELMHNYHRDKGPPRCAFKVDIQKAYDTVDWRFLGFILKRFRFHQSMIKWIMVCVTSPSYSISINGNIHGFFKGKRGLRQCDPLSPYLFTLVMEILTLILQRRVWMSDSFRFHKQCEELNIINLCFADDLFLFTRGDLDMAKIIMESLDEFKQVSGLVPSIPKSTTYFCNVLNHVKIVILSIMPFAEGDLLARNRIGDWKNKSLSFAGRLQLCKSVISSMQVYWASVLVIPMGIINDIQQLIRGFLWCNGEYKRGKSKVAWDDICPPKHEGGLGLRSLEGYNLNTCVADLIANGIWNWLHSWLVKAPTLGTIVVPNLSDRDDSIYWHASNGALSVFSVKYAWEALRSRGPEDKLRPWDVGDNVDLSSLRC